MVGQFPASCAWLEGPSGVGVLCILQLSSEHRRVLHLLCLTLSPPAWGSCHGDLRQSKPLVALEPSTQVCVYLSSSLMK